MLDPQEHVNPKAKRKPLTTEELVRSSKTLGLRAQKTVLLWLLEHPHQALQSFLQI
jgi:hypothetical protein